MKSSAANPIKTTKSSTCLIRLLKLDIIACIINN
jgi:hypothetical protein